jgi:hypothetical protein
MWTSIHKIYPSTSIGYAKCKHTWTNVIKIFQETFQMSFLEFQKHSQWHNAHAFAFNYKATQESCVDLLFKWGHDLRNKMIPIIFN